MARVIIAKKIITMDMNMPEATHVAIKNGRIFAVGNEDILSMIGPHEINEQFADFILMPGFVEGHAHALEGGIWEQTYVGFHDRYDPRGKLWVGAKNLKEVIQILQAEEQKITAPEEALFSWGFDPIYFGEERISVKELDRVSRTRPILILHSNGHLLNVNSKLLEMAGISDETDVYGVLKDKDGKVTGELMEMAAQYMVYRKVSNPFFDSLNASCLREYSKSCVNAGITTATDLFATFDDDSLNTFSATTQEENFPIRLVPAMNTLTLPFDEGIQLVKKSQKRNHDKLHFGLCKVMTDGSIQGFTGRLRSPGYFNGAPNGLWNMPPQTLTDLVLAYHKAGMHLHLHTNGDEATELIINAIEEAQTLSPRFDHRHTLQHCQMADQAQFTRMAKLGISVNLFANHIYYWGDQHYAITMGPDRARRMNACRSALNSRVPLAIHSDAPVTPLGPLFTAWCAVNRLTESGKVLGAHQRITVEEALYAITMGAAYTLKMDHLIGSISTEKYADFVVLEEDPHAIAPSVLKDLKIWGTITGGVAQQTAPKASTN